jgi:hypothetical protein
MTRSTIISATLVSVALLPLVACSSSARPAKGESGDSSDTISSEEKARQLRSWEASNLKRFALELPDGIMVADVEAIAPPKVSCEETDTMRSCAVELPIGETEDGTPRAVECLAMWIPVPPPFGRLTKEAIGQMSLAEVPRFEAEWSEGEQPALIAKFAADTALASEEGTLIGTLKVAARYAPAHTLFCGERQAGGKETFTRVVSGFFESVRLSDSSPQPVLQSVRRHRTGDAHSGFEVSYVFDNDDGGHSEFSANFRLETTERQWGVRDRVLAVQRDRKGTVESLREVFVDNRGLSSVLSAKRTESGKLRLKLERDGKSDALELTPKAPLSTELWESPALLRVSSGRAAKHKYAFLSVDRDGEPTLGYAKFARLSGNVVQEEVEVPGRSSAQERNELTVDEGGFVLKQVSSGTITERLHHSGRLPGGRAVSNTGKGKRL